MVYKIALIEIKVKPLFYLNPMPKFGEFVV